MTEGRNDGMTDKANTKCPLAILWRGHKKTLQLQISYLITPTSLAIYAPGLNDREHIVFVLSVCLFV